MRLLQNTLKRPVLGVDFGRDGRTLVAGGSGGFDVWDLPAGRRHFIATATSGLIFACIPDPLGRWLYFSEHRGGCSLYDLASGEARRFPGEEDRVVSVAAAPDGRRVAMRRLGATADRLECWSIADDGSLRLAWDVAARPTYTSYTPVYALAFDRAGRTVAAVEDRPAQGSRGTVHSIVLRNASGGEQQAEFGSVPYVIYPQIAFAPNGERLICRGEEQFAVWEVATGTQVGTVFRPGRANFNGLAVHPSGQFFLTASGDGQARFWDAQTLQQTRALHWKIGKLHSVAFSRDGMLAAAGGDKGQVVVWDLDA